METKTLSQLPQEELAALLVREREFLRKYRFEVHQSQSKNVRKLRDTRRKIARILTILKNKTSSYE